MEEYRFNAVKSSGERIMLIVKAIDYVSARDKAYVFL